MSRVWSRVCIARWLLGCLLWLLASALCAEPWRESPLLAEIEARGTLRVGVKTDFPPLGMLNASGEPIGLEIDLAHAMARALGVEAEIVPVSTESRFQRLEQGAIDLMIATAGDTRERRQLATVIEPNYYGAGVSVLLRRDSGITSWDQLRNQTLCALQGAYFNRPMARSYQLVLQLYRSVRDAQLALRDGRCVGFLYTDVTLEHALGEPEWAEYVVPLPSALIVPWAMNLPRSERGSVLEQRVGDVVAEWHRSGELIRMEGRWLAVPSAFLADAQALWQARGSDGEYRCRRGADGQWPVDCRNLAFVTAADVDGLRGVGLWLRDQFGINLSVLYDPYDAARYLRGLALSVALSATAIVAALLLGYLGARLMLARSALVRVPAGMVAGYLRMTPPLLLLYVLFFGLGGQLWAAFGISLSPFAIGVLCLGLYHAGMIARSLVDAALLERSRDSGYVLRLATLDRLLEAAAVGIRAALNNLVRLTMVVAAIAVPELLSVTLAIIGERGNVNEMMNLLLLSFYLLTTLWVVLLTALERRLIARARRSRPELPA